MHANIEISSFQNGFNHPFGFNVQTIPEKTDSNR